MTPSAPIYLAISCLVLPCATKSSIPNGEYKARELKDRLHDLSSKFLTNKVREVYTTLHIQLALCSTQEINVQRKLAMCDVCILANTKQRQREPLLFPSHLNLDHISANGTLS